MSWENHHISQSLVELNDSPIAYFNSITTFKLMTFINGRDQMVFVRRYIRYSNMELPNGTHTYALLVHLATIELLQAINS